tara:strand:- start:2322 stop:2570 length:249 start_codon:yes stop_codon:yes gene_type:complete
MSNRNNVLPFPVKMDSTLLEFRQVISELIILEAQTMKMMEEIDLVEDHIGVLMDRRDELLEDLRRKELIHLAMEVVEKQDDN